MLYSRLVNESIPINEAISTLRSNHKICFEWLSARNKAGNLVEIGGRSTIYGLDLRVSVPFKNQGKIEVHQNGFVRSDVTLEFDAEYGEYSISLPSANGERRKITEELFIKTINQDLYKIRVTIVPTPRVTYDNVAVAHFVK